MKKIALTSLLAVFAVSGAHAANVIDGNPLYMPESGHFYSVTSIESHSDHFKTWAMNEEFGLGILDMWTIAVKTDLADEQSFDQWGWNDLSLNTTFRILDFGHWKTDLIGGYGVGNVWPDHQPWLEKDLTYYTWTAGLRSGYMGSGWAVAGHALFNYENSESFNWNHDGEHRWNFGLDGQLNLSESWSLLAGVEYTGYSDSWAHNEGSWGAELGVNYNLDATKFFGLYVKSGLEHKNNSSSWEIEDGFGFGAKFGIDF